MNIPQRIFRFEVDDLPGERDHRTTRDYACQDRILRAAQHLIARHGRISLTLTDLAVALRMSRATLRRHYCDLDSILSEILSRHLQAIATALGKVPFDAPDAPAARRAAYLAYTRTPFNAPTEAHLLLIRDRHALPPDLAGPIEDIRQSVGLILAGFDGTVALTLLDTMELQAPQIETILASLQLAAAPQPERPPQTQAPEPAPSDIIRYTTPRLVSAEPVNDLLRLRRHAMPAKPTQAIQARAGP